MNICPKCGRQYEGYPATSRIDNKTKICSDCGLREALEDYADSIRKEGEADERRTKTC